MSVHVRGAILPDGDVHDVYVVDGRLTYIRPPNDVDTLASEGFVIPGLVDVHAHLELASPAGDGASPLEKIRASLSAHLDAGVLAVREPGGPSRLSTGMGPANGLPRTFTAGRFLSVPGAYVPGLAREIDEDDLPDAAVEELRHGTGWVKVIGERVHDGRFVPSFRPDVIAETARRVHAAGGRLAMHVSQPDAIGAAVDAGFDSIEHGVMAQREHFVEMRRRGTAFVPTMIAMAAMLPHARDMVAAMGVDPAAAEELVNAATWHGRTVAAALDEGVRVLAGTDAAIGPHGMVRLEIESLIAAGMARAEALGAGSWDARRFLGLGGLEEGAPADLVVFGEDPRQQPGALGSPILIILDGVVVKRSATG